MPLSALKVHYFRKFTTMAKAAKKKAPKKRASKYEEPVKFNGTFEEMVLISTTGAGANKKPNPKK